MKKYLTLFCVITLLMPSFNIWALDEPADLPEESLDENLYPYPKLDDLMKELKEKRKIIEQQRLEEIKAKKLEQEQKAEIEGEKGIEDVKSDEAKEKDNEKSEKSKIPGLIVRLRGKHSTKYLCGYDLTFSDDNKESALAKELITDYNTLLNKPSLKVRAGEKINFEFSTVPKSMDIYIYNEEGNKHLTSTRGTISVPDLEEKIVVIVEGRYKNGWVRYAVVLDIRK